MKNLFYKLGQQAALIKVGAAPGSGLQSSLSSIGGLSGGGGIKPTGSPLSPGGLKNPLIGGGRIKTPKGLKPRSEPTAGANVSPIEGMPQPVGAMQDLVTQNAYGILSGQALSSPQRRMVGSPG